MISGVPLFLDDETVAYIDHMVTHMSDKRGARVSRSEAVMRIVKVHQKKMQKKQAATANSRAVEVHI